jgi:hypothetical protein
MCSRDAQPDFVMDELTSDDLFEGLDVSSDMSDFPSAWDLQGDDLFQALLAGDDTHEQIEEFALCSPDSAIDVSTSWETKSLTCDEELLPWRAKSPPIVTRPLFRVPKYLPVQFSVRCFYPDVSGQSHVSVFLDVCVFISAAEVREVAAEGRLQSTVVSLYDLFAFRRGHTPLAATHNSCVFFHKYFLKTAQQLQLACPAQLASLRIELSTAVQFTDLPPVHEFYLVN